MKEHNLISRLKSVKRFFLLDQGDFLNQFIDLADDELKMPVSDITSSRLEALLEISIRTSAADKDPYKDDLKVVLSDKDLITQERYRYHDSKVEYIFRWLFGSNSTWGSIETTIGETYPTLSLANS